MNQKDQPQILTQPTILNLKNNSNCYYNSQENGNNQKSLSDGSIEDDEKPLRILQRNQSQSSSLNSVANEGDDNISEHYRKLVQRRRKKDSQKLRQSVEQDVNPITKKLKSDSDINKEKSENSDQNGDLDSENNNSLNLSRKQFSTPIKINSNNLTNGEKQNSTSKINSCSKKQIDNELNNKDSNDSDGINDDNNDSNNKNSKNIVNKKVEEKQNSKQIEKLNKQMSTGINLDNLDISMLQKNYSEIKKNEQNPLKITNTKIPEKQSAYQVLKNLLLYIFSDDGRNPLWLFVQSKEDIKNMVFLQIKIDSGIDFINMIKQKKLDFICQQYFQNERKQTDVKDNYCPIKNNFWLSVFGYLAPGKKIEQKIKDININKILKSTSYNKNNNLNNNNQNENNKQFNKQDQNNLINGESVKQKEDINSEVENQNQNQQNDDQSQSDSNEKNNQQKQSSELSDNDVKKFSTFVLTAEEQWNNLYPQQNKDGFKHYALSENSPLKTENVDNVNKILALDCEMVRTNIGCLELARVTLINFRGEKLIDEFVKPENPIIDYNTTYSGITPQLLENVKTNLKQMQEKFLQFVNPDILLIGHSLENDLNALQLIHLNVIDTSVLFLSNGRKQSLKNLTKQYFNKSIQQVTHDSMEDALAALNLVKIAKATYSNGNEMKNEKQISFNLIQSIKKANNSVMIIDNKENLDQLTNQGINFEDIGKSEDADYKCVLNKLIKMVKPDRKKSQFVPNIIMTKIQKKKQEYQTQFCFNINSKIKELYNEVSEKTFMMIHFDIDNSKNTKDNTKPFCLFFNK